MIDIGSKVEFSSTKTGHKSEGIVIEVIPPQMLPTSDLYEFSVGANNSSFKRRNFTSYAVQVGKKIYFPYGRNAVKPVAPSSEDFHLESYSLADARSHVRRADPKSSITQADINVLREMVDNGQRLLRKLETAVSR